MQLSNPSTVINNYLIAQDPLGAGSDRLPVSLPFRIGRMEGFDLCVECPNVSALHAEIVEEDGGRWVYDLESTNGTYVNGQRIETKQLLNDGDTIQMGSCSFRFVSGDTLDAKTDAAVETGADGATDTQEQRFQRLLDNTSPFFQPVYEIAKSQRRLIGYEVLGRSSVSGLRTPAKMFAAAISLSMESELSRFFRQLGVEVAQDKIPEGMKLFLNTHPAELNRNNLEDSLRELREAFPSRAIVLELSAAYLVEPDSISYLRKLLKTLEIELALHDFGVGLLPIAELSEIAPDFVKFDSSLTNEINGAAPKQQRLVRAMVKMVKELGITPMAESVESPDEDKTLTQLGFEFAQGFYYGRPNAIETIELPTENGQPCTEAELTTEKSNLRPLDLAQEAESLTTTAEGDQKQRETITTIGTPEAPKNVRDSQWLLQQPDDHYAIQLTMLQSQSSAKEFINQQKLPGDYAWYHRPGRSKSWFIVLCGSFGQRERAKAEAERFKEVGVMPLVRRLSAVQNEVLKMQRTETDTKKG